LQAALADTPVVLVVGPRQAGKSTLVAELLDEPTPRPYITLDDAAETEVLEARENQLQDSAH
jgi:uncharacterized protein